MEFAFEITPQEFKKRLDNGEDIFILDVREPQEYAICNIDGCLMPMNTILARINELNPEQHIVAHCHHGMRSERVVAYLRQQGFKKIQNLAGGIDAWSLTVDSTVARY